MIDLAIISGSGFYDLDCLENIKDIEIKTKYGNVDIKTGTIYDKKIAFIARHGKNHKRLPNIINYKANMLALKQLNTKAIIGATVCGVLDKNIALAKTFIFDDLYFPENRLSNGDICTIYDDAEDKKKGHYIFSKPFNEKLRQALIKVAKEPITDAVYAHVNGPRFNSKSEIKMIKNYATCVSQTAGPEVVLAGELEIPYVLIGYGIDYANGIMAEPTQMEVLNKNLTESKSVFINIITDFINDYIESEFDGFVYRFWIY